MQTKQTTTSFILGWQHPPQGKTKELKDKLLTLFKVKSDPAWRARLYGTKELTVSEAQKVKEIFKEYGINNIWGGQYNDHARIKENQSHRLPILT